MGDTHLDIAASRLQRKFGVEVNLDVPRVPFKETITVPVKAEYKHKKQTGGHGQYGHVVIKMEPLPPSGGFEFEAKVVGGSVPRNFIPAVEKGVKEARVEGVMAGFPAVDMKVTLIDGSFHPVDSSEMAFKIASAQAFKKGMNDASPVLLEPIMNITVTVPDSFTGDIIGDLNTKRAHVSGMNPSQGMNVIQAQAPLAEILALCHRPALHDAGQRNLHRRVQPLSGGAGAYRAEDSRPAEERCPARVTRTISSK